MRKAPADPDAGLWCSVGVWVPPGESIVGDARRSLNSASSAPPRGSFDCSPTSASLLSPSQNLSPAHARQAPLPPGPRGLAPPPWPVRLVS